MRLEKSKRGIEMKTRSMIIASCLLLFAPGVLAQVDPDPDQMGIYFDTEANTYCLADVPIDTQVSAYLCLTNQSALFGIGGWEANVEVINGTVLAWNIQGDYISVYPPPNFVVGVYPPLPISPSVVLMEIVILVSETTPIQFILHPSTPSSFDPPSPGYGYIDDEGNVPLQPCGYSVGSEIVCAEINGDCQVISNENMTWGVVKQLFK
jgi:hypothetical protein